MAILGGWRITRAGMLFVGGIIVLAALVFGGIWLVRERGEQARREDAIKVAEENLQKQSEVATQPTNNAQQDNSSEQTPTSVPQTGVEELPATGIEDLAPVLVLAIVALAAGYYVSSRRALAEL